MIFTIGGILVLVLIILLILWLVRRV